MLYTNDVIAWLQAFPTYPVDNGYPVPIIGLDNPTDVPGRAVFISIGGGTPTLDERTLDVHMLQLQCRGPQKDLNGAEHFAAAIDNLIMSVVCPTEIGRRVIDIDYFGGPPHWMTRDTADRDHFINQYLITIAREVF